MRGATATQPRDDATLVLRALNGSHEAFGELVTRYQRMLYRQALGLGLDHDTALDLVQDAFVRGWDRLADCRDPAAFRAWVSRILRNLCLDHFKNRRQQTVPLSALPEDADFPDPRSERDSLTRLEVGEAMETVPLLLREAFLLRHDAGYSYDEIATIVDATPAAVKMRVHRAREYLCTVLGAETGATPSLMST
jgi:RNA polymerase sigma-70 factor, ECF subfamily